MEIINGSGRRRLWKNGELFWCGIRSGFLFYKGIFNHLNPLRGIGDFKGDRIRLLVGIDKIDLHQGLVQVDPFVKSVVVDPFDGTTGDINFNFF